MACPRPHTHRMTLNHMAHVPVTLLKEPSPLLYPKAQMLNTGLLNLCKTVIGMLMSEKLGAAPLYLGTVHGGCFKRKTFCDLSQTWTHR